MERIEKQTAKIHKFYMWEVSQSAVRSGDRHLNLVLITASRLSDLDTIPSYPVDYQMHCFNELGTTPSIINE